MLMAKLLNLIHVKIPRLIRQVILLDLTPSPTPSTPPTAPTPSVLASVHLLSKCSLMGGSSAKHSSCCDSLRASAWVPFLLGCLWRGKQKMTTPRSKGPGTTQGAAGTCILGSPMPVSTALPPSMGRLLLPLPLGTSQKLLLSSPHSRAPLISRKGKPISTHRKWLLESELQFLKPENDSRCL